MVPKPNAVAFRVLEHGEGADSIYVRRWNNDLGTPVLGLGHRPFEVLHRDIHRQIRLLMLIDLVHTAVDTRARVGAYSANGRGCIHLPTKHLLLEATQRGCVLPTNLKMDDWITHCLQP